METVDELMADPEIKELVEDIEWIAWLMREGEWEIRQ